LDIDEGKITASWKAHKQLITALAYSVDGKHIVSGGKDFRVRVWDGEKGTPVGKALRGHSGHSNCLAFSSDNVHFASCNNTEIVLWAVGTPKVRMRFTAPDRGGKFTTLAFSPDGSRIFAGIDSNILACDLEGNIVLEPLTCPALDNGTINSIIFDKNGRCMVSTSGKGAVIVWDPITREIITGPLEGHDHIIDSLAFSPDGQYLVSAARNKIVRVWSTKERPNTGRQLLSQRNTEIRCIALSPDGVHGASGADDGIIRIWNSKESGAKVLKELVGHITPVDSVAFSQDGSRLVSCSRQDSAIRVWDLDTGKFACEPVKINGHPLAVGFVPDILSQTTVSFRYVTMRSKLSGVTVPLLNTSEFFLPRRKSTDDTSSISSAGSPKIPNPGAYKARHHLHPRSTTYLCADGATIVSCSGRTTIKVKDKDSLSRTWLAPDSVTCVTSVAISPDGEYLVFGADENIFVGNVSEPDQIYPALLGHRDKVTAVAFSEDGSRIASASLDGTIRIRSWPWDPTCPPLFAFSPNSAHSITATDPLYGESSSNAERYSQYFMEKGWIEGEQGELLFWVPPENRAGLWVPDILAVVGEHPTTLDLSCFVHGESWTGCYKS
jgi:WD40 repeat protein